MEGKETLGAANWHAARAAAMLSVLLVAGLAAQGKRVTATDGWVKLSAPGEIRAMAFVAIENPTMYEIPAAY